MFAAVTVPIKDFDVLRRVLTAVGASKLYSFKEDTNTKLIRVYFFIYRIAALGCATHRLCKWFYLCPREFVVDRQLHRVARCVRTYRLLGHWRRGSNVRKKSFLSIFI